MGIYRTGGSYIERMARTHCLPTPGEWVEKDKEFLRLSQKKPFDMDTAKLLMHTVVERILYWAFMAEVSLSRNEVRAEIITFDHFGRSTCCGTLSMRPEDVEIFVRMAPRRGREDYHIHLLLTGVLK